MAAPVPVMPHVEHLRQRRSWDCGLTCIAMVLRTLKTPVDTLASLQDALEAEAVHQSMWTIHLALLLHHRCVPLRFMTDLIGVDPRHADQAFYASLEDDKERVETAFALAKERGIPIQCPAPDIDYFCELLAAGRSMFIVLVDLRHVRCSRCPISSAVASLSFSYAGHYILLTGYSFETDEVEYADPARSDARCYMKTADLDTARRAPGTDADAIEVLLMLQ